MSFYIQFPVRFSVRFPLSKVRPETVLLSLALLVPCAASVAQTADAITTAPTATLSLTRAQALAVARSRQLVAQDSAVVAAREMAIAAGQLPDPVLKFAIDNLPVTTADRFSLNRDFMTMRRVGVMQELTSADKRRYRSDRLDREADKTLAEKQVTLAAIGRETAIAWLERYYSEAMTAVIQDQGAQATLEVQAAEGAYRAGRGNQSDLLAARSAVASFDDRASDTARRVRSAVTMLARWVGDAATLPLGGPPDMAKVRLDPSQLEQQLSHHPEIAVLRRQEDIAQADARLAQAGRSNDWTVELAYQQRGPEYSNMISIGVSIPLQWDRKNRQDRELSARLALVDKAQAEREDTLRMHVAETRAMFDEWQTDRERIDRYERELLPLANDRTLAAVAAYRGGKAALTDVLAARRNAIEVRIQALQLQADSAKLWARLNFLAADDRMHAGMPMSEMEAK